MDKTEYFALLTNILEVNSSWRENFGAAGIQITQVDPA